MIDPINLKILLFTIKNQVITNFDWHVPGGVLVGESGGGQHLNNKVCHAEYNAKEGGKGAQHQ